MFLTNQMYVVGVRNVGFRVELLVQKVSSWRFDSVDQSDICRRGFCNVEGTSKIVVQESARGDLGIPLTNQVYVVGVLVS